MHINKMINYKIVYKKYTKSNYLVSRQTTVISVEIEYGKDNKRSTGSKNQRGNDKL
jgi:hypothetical protein